MKRINDDNRPQGTPPLWLSAALALLFVVVQLAPFIHLGLEDHEICAEHGKIIHPEHEHRAAPSPQDGLAHLRPGVPVGAHLHDTCVLCQATDAPGLGQRGGLYVAQPEPPIRLSAVAPVTWQAFVPHRLYRIAPKQSPPVV